MRKFDKMEVPISGCYSFENYAVQITPLELFLMILRLFLPKLTVTLVTSQAAQNICL